MSADQWALVALVVYVVGLFPASYSVGRFTHGSQMTGLALMWPILLPMLAVILPLMKLSEMGEKHAAVSRRRKRL